MQIHTVRQGSHLFSKFSFTISWSFFFVFIYISLSQPLFFCSFCFFVLFFLFQLYHSRYCALFAFICGFLFHIPPCLCLRFTCLFRSRKMGIPAERKLKKKKKSLSNACKYFSVYKNRMVGVKKAEQTNNRKKKI